MKAINILLLSCLLIASCSHRRAYKYSDFPTPFIFVRQTGGSLDDPTGPVAVLWNDGKLMLPTTASTIGSSYVISNVTSQSLQSVEKFILKSGLSESEEGGPIVTDERTVIVQVKYHHGSKNWLHWAPLPPESSIAKLILLLESLPRQGSAQIKWEEEYPSAWE